MNTTRRLIPVGALALIGLASALALAQDKPRSGGVLNWYVYADPGRLDIHAESPLSVQQATAGVFSGLLQHDPDQPGKIVGDLAERWTVSPDGKVYTFHLRKGVRWHDGQPFTATDVKTTFDRVLNPNFQSPRCGSMLKPLVAGVEVLDPHTVQFTLKFPAAPFVPSLGSAWCRIAAKHVLDKHGDLAKPEAQIGTGPFKFKRYERGSVIEWEKNKDYFLVYGLALTETLTERILDPERGAFAHDWKARVGHPVSQRVFVNRGGTLPRRPPSVQARDVGPGLVHEGREWRVTAAPAEHVQPFLDSLAYRIDGADGSIVFTGDTQPCPSVTELARGADMMLCMCWDDQERMEALGEVSGTCGTLGAARMAEEAGVKRLVLVHIGPYLAQLGPMEKGIGDVRRHYSGEVVFADELLALRL